MHGSEHKLEELQTHYSPLETLPLISTPRKRESWSAAPSSGATSAGRTARPYSRTARHRVPSPDTVNPRRYSFWPASPCHSQSGSWTTGRRRGGWKGKRGTGLSAPSASESSCVKSVSLRRAPDTHLRPQAVLRRTVLHSRPRCRCHSVL